MKWYRGLICLGDGFNQLACPFTMYRYLKPDWLTHYYRLTRSRQLPLGQAAHREDWFEGCLMVFIYIPLCRMISVDNITSKLLGFIFMVHMALMNCIFMKSLMNTDTYDSTMYKYCLFDVLMWLLWCCLSVATGANWWHIRKLFSVVSRLIVLDSTVSVINCSPLSLGFPIFQYCKILYTK